jgi:hypothetical protein
MKIKRSELGMGKNLYDLVKKWKNESLEAKKASDEAFYTECINEIEYINNVINSIFYLTQMAYNEEYFLKIFYKENEHCCIPTELIVSTKKLIEKRLIGHFS